MDWYVVHTRLGRECCAAARLACDLCLQVYVPQVLQRQAGSAAAVPLFPGYFFVAWPPGEQPASHCLEAISRIPGGGVVVRRAPGCAPGLWPPATLPAPVIAWLRCRVAAIDAAGGLPFQLLAGGGAAPDPGAADGAAAAIAALAAATSGLHSPAARTAALLRLLGCRADNTPDEGEPDPPAATRLRRTRGHGRRIHYR